MTEDNACVMILCSYEYGNSQGNVMSKYVVFVLGNNKFIPLFLYFKYLEKIVILVKDRNFKYVVHSSVTEFGYNNLIVQKI